MSIIGSHQARWARRRNEQKARRKTDSPAIRDIEAVDAELRQLAQAWRIARKVLGRPVGTALLDELLDERLAVASAAGTATTQACSADR